MLKRVVHDNQVVTYQSPLLQQADVLHGFSTRLGGVSQGAFGKLNLGLTPGTFGQSAGQSGISQPDIGQPVGGDPSHLDDSRRVAENFRRLRSALGLDGRIKIQAPQVHGAEVWCPPLKPLAPGKQPACDALVTHHAQHMLVCRTADCVPVLLATEDGAWVSCVHAGWRGLIAGVIGQAVGQLRQQASSDESSVNESNFDQAGMNLIAAIGPCIGLAHFEVGDEVAEVFEQAGLGQVIDSSFGLNKPHIDLQKAAHLQLQQVGVTDIDGHELCTYRDQTEFFSYRRDGQVSGRMAAVISPRPVVS